MRVLITGITGFIGSRITQRLMKAGHTVVGCVRDIKRGARLVPGIELIECDFTRDHDAKDWIPRLQNIDCVINAIGIIQESGKNTFQALHTDAPKALFKACAEAGVKRVIQISALGADENAKSRYHLSKKEADDYLSSLNLDWIIVPPSIVYGPGGKSAELFTAIAALPVVPLIGKGDQKLQPIFIDDLTDLIAKLVEDPALKRIRLAAAGPEPITFAQMLDAYRKWLGLKKAIHLNIPLPLVRFGAWLSGLTKTGMIDSETLNMLLRGNVANPEPFTRAAGMKPKSMKDALWTLSSPETFRFHARLYFLIPLLRLSIAFVWIASGIASAFFYPIEKSYELLSQAGVSGALAPVSLYGASFLDFFIGLAVFAKYKTKLIGILQIALILSYTLIISFSIPEFWFHPFGPITKNIPMIVGILILMAAEE